MPRVYGFGRELLKPGGKTRCRIERTEFGHFAWRNHREGWFSDGSDQQAHSAAGEEEGKDDC